MNTHADKTKENKHQSVVNAAEKQSNVDSTFQFVDNRPEVLAQRMLQDRVNNSSQVNQLRTFQDMADSSPQGKQAPQFQPIATIRQSSQSAVLQKKIASPAENKKDSMSSDTVIQRMISMNDWHRVYSPHTIGVDARYRESMNTLMGGNYTIQQITWANLKNTVWPNGIPEDSPLQEIHNKFQHPRKVHVYANIQAAQYDGQTEVKNLLLPDDMSEAADPLPAVLAPASACVIQSLVDFGIAAPGKAATDHAWHTWSVEQNLDYRTDSDIIRIYVGQLGYRLVNNTTVTMAAFNWAEHGGDGNYLVASYVGMPAGVGHMIGVTIHAGAIQTVHDRQNLTAPTLNQNPAGVTARYIYKM